MKKIINPFLSIPSYNCFGCAPDNEHGMRMEFFDAGDEIVCKWTPDSHFQGYGNILHGGIQGAMLDEIAGWAVMILMKTAGVTSRMEVKYKKPVYTTNGQLTLKARVRETKRHLAFIDAFLYDNEDILCAQAEVVYSTFSPEAAREKLNYPGIEAFYEG